MEELEELREQIKGWVVPGFQRRDEVVEAAIEYAEDDGVLTAEQVTQLVDEVWEQRLQKQRTWVEVTDADRFAAAFAELDAAGVVARMNFTCCQGCGSTEIFDERPADRQSKGYVFFHQQDAEGLADTPAALYLAYGPFDAVESTWESRVVEVGHQIVAGLRAHDLPVTWSGSSAQRIQVGPLTWQRRLPER
ncbi:hypothetical protein E1263_11085 [Kribbella antibiotica]|uniref:DUF6891 domain-containing protein n=1 Tax=Kribbella antibiotica TaxID=190195 RepID=A0A4R4ZQY3_9ACTN|nr:hypothetical protein [Kribbella antibiotica]TDD60464.1 hypothetical protein E1263_11085 [Kribbella antibiotica]